MNKGSVFYERTVTDFKGGKLDRLYTYQYPASSILHKKRDDAKIVSSNHSGVSSINPSLAGMFSGCMLPLRSCAF